MTKIDHMRKIYDQIDSLHTEIGVLAKKNPNDVLNAFKVKLINGILTQANDDLGADRMPLQDFSTFDTDDLPSASDVIIILGIYKGALWRAITS